MRFTVEELARKLGGRVEGDGTLAIRAVAGLREAQAGEIVAILGWKDAVGGETLSDADDRLVLEAIRTQPPVLSLRPVASAFISRSATSW